MPFCRRISLNCAKSTIAHHLKSDLSTVPRPTFSPFVIIYLFRRQLYASFMSFCLNSTSKHLPITKSTKLIAFPLCSGGTNGCGDCMTSGINNPPLWKHIHKFRALCRRIVGANAENGVLNWEIWIGKKWYPLY